LLPVSLVVIFQGKCFDIPKTPMDVDSACETAQEINKIVHEMKEYIAIGETLKG